MKVFVAIDSFKACLSSVQACEAAGLGLRDAGIADDEICILPLSDGGEGFCDAVLRYAGGERVKVCGQGPDGNASEACYVLSGDVAYIESASVCGYAQMADGMRHPMRSSSYGLGLLIRHAAKSGVSKIIVGLGGTCTCDGGAGMLQALGVKFLSDNGSYPDGMPLLCRPVSGLDLTPLLSFPCSLEAWVDTGAGFHGEGGAVSMFGPQKGLGRDELVPADDWMRRLSELYSSASAFHPSDNCAGHGAAGGIGGALAIVLGAGISYGSGKMVGLCGLSEKLRACGGDKVLVLTGEGRYDSQTATGKLPFMVARTAHELCPHACCVCLAGQVADSADGCFDSVVQVTPDGMDIKKAMDPSIALRNIRQSVYQLIANLLKEDA